MNTTMSQKILPNRSLSIDLLEVISNMDLTKEQKEDLALSSLKLTREQANVLWKDDRIEAVRLNKAMEHIELTIVINKNGEVTIND